MVDFRKRLTGKNTEKPVDPVELYDTLDRASDKGPLRPAQLAVLKEWYKSNENTRDAIVKLHTGQGKTLIGLLILQSRINANKGPVVFLCPDNFLITQACEQAEQFGIATCTTDSELPSEFLDGTKMLITSAKKLFNGITKFGINNKSMPVDTILMDDAHACVDIIREACRIRIPTDEPAYQAIRTLFANELEAQGAGTWADIRNGKRDALLPVPYWAWMSREAEIAGILSKNTDRTSIKFTWPLIKDMLSHCQCMISGAAVEIEPYIAPLKSFGSYWKAKHRVFMSATVTDDAFLVKGLQLAPETIMKPLSYENETWSGERMILLPSLIHEDLRREKIVEWLAKANPKKRFGIVTLTPSFARTKDWEKYGATITGKDNVSEVIEKLKQGHVENTIVLVNRYDGIDLPDSSCRILIFDSRPYTENLFDLYQELCRPDSEATLMRVVRSIEQGMGRSVRGEKDYCVVITIGDDLVRMLHDRTIRKYLSDQMIAQIDLGFDIAKIAKQEIEESDQKPLEALRNLVNQCLRRDADWKAFYVEQMDRIVPSDANNAILQVYAAELKAEESYISGDYKDATDILQSLLNETSIESDDDRGWYLQEMARYNLRTNREESEHLQITAHKKNRMLLKPPSGVTIAKLEIISQGRIERIINWIGNYEDYTELNANISDILSNLVFGVKADKFENALDKLSVALGFVGERPDKEWKEGPDNLWALDDTHYLLWECKNEVDITRAEINKRETEQMNRSNAWFDKIYRGYNVKRIIIHPSHRVQSAAAFTHDDVEIMREKELRQLVKSVREFFKSFESVSFQDLSARQVQKFIEIHKLSVSDLLSVYSKKPHFVRR